MVCLITAAIPFELRTQAADLTPQQQVEGQLMCYCGCSDLTVPAYVAQHGEQIRSAPTKSGFDLVAWVTPFLLLALAGSALVVVVRRWGSLRTSPPAAPGAPPAKDHHAPSPEERKALERVRREMRERR